MHDLHRKLKEELQFINTVIKKNSTLERKNAQLQMQIGKLFGEVARQRDQWKSILEEEISGIRGKCEEDLKSKIS